MTESPQTIKSESSEPTQGMWTVSVAGISKVTGLLIQASHTIQGDLKEAMKGLSQISVMFAERGIEPIVPAIAEALSKVFAVPIEDALKAIPAPAPAPDVIKSVKVHSMKLMYTDNGNPYLAVKAQPGLMMPGLSAWLETWEPILGNDKEVLTKWGVAGEIPMPAEMQFAWAAYKNGTAPKIIGFTKDPNSPAPVE